MSTTSRAIATPRIDARARRARTTRSTRARASTEDDGPATSRRAATLRNEGAYAVLEKVAALERRSDAKGAKRVLRLEIGQPGFATPARVCDAAVRAIEGGETKYAAPSGAPRLREAVAEYLVRTRGVAYEAENVVVGPGAKPGLFLPTLACCDPGDEVVYPDPGFPTYAAMCAAAGATPRPVPLRSDGASFDMAALEASVNEKTKMIVINSPGNPTGGVMPREDVAAVARLAKKFNCWVMSDEIYSRLIYDDEEEGGENDEKIFSICALDGMKERTILVDGFSKTYCMTGWRLGWVACPKHLAEKIKLLTVHSVGCVAAFTQIAGVEALTGPQDSVKAMRDEYRVRRDFVVDALNDIPGISCPVPKGAFYAFPSFDFPDVTAQELADYLLEDARVALLPGTDFGAAGERHLRLSYVGELSDLREAMARIKTSLAKRFPDFV
jgi:aspartate/methionine/tyrosine aminotransferase